MKFLKTALLSAVAVASLQAVAEPITHTITLEAHVPSDDFYVLPNESTWITQTQKLSFSRATGNLSKLTKQFDVKNIAGGITAKLLSSATLTSNTDSIDLQVKFNNILLSTTDATVVTQAAAATASIVNLEITPVRAAGSDYAPGNYTGNVQLSFDAAI